MPVHPSLPRERRKLGKRAGSSGPKLVAWIAIAIAASAGAAVSSCVRKSEGNATGSSRNPQFLFERRLWSECSSLIELIEAWQGDFSAALGDSHGSAWHMVPQIGVTSRSKQSAQIAAPSARGKVFAE